MDWRKIEAAILEWQRDDYKSEGYPLDAEQVTDLARYLAEHLKPEASK